MSIGTHAVLVLLALVFLACVMDDAEDFWTFVSSLAAASLLLYGTGWMMYLFVKVWWKV